MTLGLTLQFTLSLFAFVRRRAATDVAASAPAPRASAAGSAPGAVVPALPVLPRKAAHRP
jgi:hypothetical protein